MTTPVSPASQAPQTIADILREKIKTHGAISMADYMETCLYTPQLGYYQTRDPFGFEGDFITAPEISQLFGEMLAIWVMDTWHNAGRPDQFALLELGPGRGTLMADLLRTMRQVLPACYNAVSIHMLEISNILKRQQRRNLSDHLDKITWHDHFESIPSQPFCIAIGNEFLDAFPVRQFIRQDGSYYEQLVTIDDQDILQETLAQKPTHLSDFYIAEKVETIPQLPHIAAQLKRIIKSGAALFIDYGAEAQGHTIQALKQHNYADIFHDPGNCDLTAHVDFSAVAKAFGATSMSPVTMSEFLVTLGLPVRASQLLEVCDETQREEIEQAAFRLLHPEQMGEMFKAFCWHNLSTAPAGFQHEA